MKHAKKLASLLLALVMVFALATTAFAAENTIISAPEGSTRTYDVYQIFTGDLHEGVLSNIKWGKNGTGAEGTAVDQTTLDALAAVNGKSDTEKLTEIQKYVKLDSEKFGTVSNGNSLTVPTGYYLIKDNGPVNDGEAYSLYVVQVVGPTTISPKVGTTTSDKKVDDKNDSNTTEDATTWQDSADYDIGDAVPFKLSATIAQELKDLEHDVLTAKDRDAALEYELFSALRAKLAESVTRVQLAASLIAQLDTLCSFAAVAVKNNYCRPCVDESGVIEIQAGRHPVVEKMRSDALFVPNDTLMGAKEDRVSIITGPNMAGKSTYMRQVALIVLMAQVGSFVPAHDAHIGVVDRIFTRIGASDDLSAGQSTFMVEMTEVSDILRTATKNSLLILDEIGRGTSTFDGMSIARAVLEHCAEKLKAKTLFATHYHELTALEQTLPNVRNYNIAVRARGEDIIFLRKIIPGGADRSYGIEVAKLAGLPDSVLKRARAILEELESQSGRPAPVAAPDDQLSLTAMAESEVAELLRRTQVDSLSPLEALNLLYDLKKRLGNG